MSKKANPAVVGAFTFGALLLLVAIILVFGSARFMQQSVDCVLYFDESLEGLDVGAPVTFRGVKIGAVKEIKLAYNVATEKFDIPVIIELYKGSAAHVNGTRQISPEWIGVLVSQKGARAQLNASSFLTGKLGIAIDFQPGTPARMAEDQTGLPQIPTVPTRLQALTQKLADLPLEDIVRDIQATVQGLNRLVNAEATQKLATNLNSALVSFQDLSQSLQTEIVPVASNLNAALASFQDLSKTLQAQVPPITKNLNDMVVAAETSMQAATEALQRIEDAVDTDSPLRFEIVNLLASMNDALRNVAALTDAMERHPESMLKGKPQKERYLNE